MHGKRADAENSTSSSKGNRQKETLCITWAFETSKPFHIKHHLQKWHTLWSFQNSSTNCWISNQIYETKETILIQIPTKSNHVKSFPKVAVMEDSRCVPNSKYIVIIIIAQSVSYTSPQSPIYTQHMYKYLIYNCCLIFFTQMAIIMAFYLVEL